MYRTQCRYSQNRQRRLKLVSVFNLIYVCESGELVHMILGIVISNITVQDVLVVASIESVSESSSSNLVSLKINHYPRYYC